MKKKYVISSVVVIFIYVLLQVIPYPSRPQTLFHTQQGEAPLVMAHGGSKHLFPENTVLAFDASFNMGVDVLETDLCMTKDGVLITHHDLTINRTSNGTGNVSDYTYEQLLEFNFGSQFVDIDGNMPYTNSQDVIADGLVPIQVEELFTRYGKNVLYVMEIKDKGELGIQAAVQLNEFINANSLQEYVCVASFDQEVLAHFNKIKDESTLISMDESTATSFIISNLVGYGIFMNYEQSGLQIPMSQMGIDLTNPYLLYKVNHNHMFVHYWTINDPDDMEKLVKAGVDGIITDRPDLLFQVLEKLGYPSKDVSRE